MIVFLSFCYGCCTECSRFCTDSSCHDTRCSRGMADVVARSQADKSNGGRVERDGDVSSALRFLTALIGTPHTSSVTEGKSADNGFLQINNGRSEGCIGTGENN